MGGGRTRYVSVRYTREEYAQVRDSAKKLGITVSAFIRSATLDRPPRRSRAPAATVTREAIHQLARVGNNLNQGIKFAHRHGFFRSEHELRKVLEAVEEKIREL